MTALAGIDIDELMNGARIAQNKYIESNLKYNECYQYAVTRNILYDEGKEIFPDIAHDNSKKYIKFPIVAASNFSMSIIMFGTPPFTCASTVPSIAFILANYNPKLHYFVEWWKQLFGESEGKEEILSGTTKVSYPSSFANCFNAPFSLSVVTYIRQRNLMETVINVVNPAIDIEIKPDEDNLDGMNFVAGKTVDYVCKKAMEGTIEAHVNGGVPNIVIDIEKLDAATIGNLIYFFELIYLVLFRLILLLCLNYSILIVFCYIHL